MAYLGGTLGNAPLQKQFFRHRKKISKHGLAPFVQALVASGNLFPLRNPKNATGLVVCISFCWA